MLSLVNLNKRNLSKISCGSGKFVLSCITVLEYRHEIGKEYFIFLLFQKGSI